MNELEISIIGGSSGSPKKVFWDSLKKFEEQNLIKTTCSIYEWSNAWAEIMKIVLYKHGPVMSQVGTTWMGSVEATIAVRPFKNYEVNQLGGANAYYPVAWKSGVSGDGAAVNAIPWFTDVYLLYYRKDLLRKAGVDFASAFANLDSFAETIEKLARAGVNIPLAITTGGASRASLHNLAGWVWTNGGDFISENGKQLLLSSPQTRQGLRDYFSLFKCMPDHAQTLTEADCQTAFLEGNAAITLRNTSLLYTMLRDPSFAKQLGHEMDLVAIPGTSFVGGSNFVFWNHIKRDQEQHALELLQKLTSPEVQYAYCKQDGFLPTRLEALQMLESEPFYSPVLEGLQRGRAFRKFKLWGLAEERLANAITQIWQQLYAHENLNVDTAISQVLDPLERRLQLTLSDG